MSQMAGQANTALDSLRGHHRSPVAGKEPAFRVTRRAKVSGTAWRREGVTVAGLPRRYCFSVLRLGEMAEPAPPIGLVDDDVKVRRGRLARGVVDVFR
jgi:hypothetical protein